VVVNIILAVICLLWTIPTLGLFVSSFRSQEDVLSTGWWTVVPHQEWVTGSQVQLQTGLPLPSGDTAVNINGFNVTDDQLRAGFMLPNGQRVQWANRRARLVNVQSQQLTSNANFTLNNYGNVLASGQYTYTTPDGSTITQ